MFAHPYCQPWTILLAGLSCSIGWGIRGNYGHETGAMFPGAITALAVCLASGREDWRRRFLFFALFGAIGWGFGGSMSYMQVISYTHSGDAATQYFGFWGLILIGFLWAALGVLGTALPCEFDQKQLTDLCRATFAVFAVWCAVDNWNWIGDLLRPLTPFSLPEGRLPTGASHRNMSRHEHPLYWFDADWIPAATALATVLILDLWQRRGRGLGHLLLCTAGSAAAGFVLQRAIGALGATDRLARVFVRPLGDLDQFRPEQLISNWPTGFERVSMHWGVIVGGMSGMLGHFLRRGEFARSLGLPGAMATGWLAGFIVFPVLLDLRMTPPRGDNWSGLLGAFCGSSIYLWRHGGRRVVVAAIVGGTCGGIAFSATAWIKLLMVSLGNPNLVADSTVVAEWAHWQSANWHSFLEQTYGFLNGMAVLIGIGLLVQRSPRISEGPFAKPAIAFAAGFVLLYLTYANMVKNVADWTRPLAATVAPMAKTMKAPLLGWEWSAAEWFNLFAASAALMFTALLLTHLTRPLALLPESALGRGQWLYLGIVWIFVVGNFTKALAGYTQARLLTEGIIALNAMLATLLILLWIRSDRPLEPAIDSGKQPIGLPASLALLAVIMLALPPLEWLHVRSIYGNVHAGHAGQDFRFGPKASWKVKPLLRGTEHR